VFVCKKAPKPQYTNNTVVKTSKTDDTSYHENEKIRVSEFLTLFINQFNKPISQPATIALKKRTQAS
jgi:hypothetical protein